MEFRQLQCFLAVAETLNFSRAAENLYISQPALSYQIQELEKELSVPLFSRDRRRVYLTPSGQALIGPAKALVDQVEELPSVAKQGVIGPEGMLRIGFDSTEDHFELIGVTQALADFIMANPGVHVEMVKQPFTECADRVIYDELDVAFLILRHKEKLPPDLISRPVFKSRIIMVIKSDSPARTCAEAIRIHDVLLVGEKPRGNSRMMKILEDMKLKPTIHRVDSLTAGFVYAQLGSGIMLLSETYYKHHHYPGLRAIYLDSDAAFITHEIVWNRANHNPNIVRLLDILPTV